MYDLPQFKASSNAEVLAFMQAHPFITLCGIDENCLPVATHVPVMVTEKNDRVLLCGHVKRKTDHHKAFAQNPAVLAIFTGPHAYISASWYPNPQTVSTWNYQAVHASGQLRFGGDDMLRPMLEELTAHFENNPDSPALMHKMPADYVEMQMKAIVAFEVELTAIRHVFKLSQNRDEATRSNIVQHLQQYGEPLAEVMEKRK